VLPVLLGLGVICLLGWVVVGVRAGRGWDMSPVAEDEPSPPPPESWPPVLVVVPARNERDTLPLTLPRLAAQDYPGPWRIVVVDDRSTDGTAEAAARAAAGRAQILAGAELPPGWRGKVWALQQGAASARESYLLLTDADILHAPHSLRRLVAESEAGGLSLNSRMARLRCDSPAERLLIPPFIWFFNLLYPLRLVNRPASPVAAAAGGCMLVRREALERSGGFASIRGELIDDVNLARGIKSAGGTLRLSLSRVDVQSQRSYETLGPLWKMVRRTAFTELKRSWIRLAVAVAALAVMFVVPPLLVAAGIGLAFLDIRFILVGLLGFLAWTAMAWFHRRAPQFFGLSAWRGALLPLSATLYGLMTVDSALRGGGRDWR
jgi:hopene-associated glycosyltransferase HpnB